MVARLSAKLDGQVPALSVLDHYFAGTQPMAFLSAEAKEALGNRLRALSINYAAMGVTALTERLRIEGFRSADEGLTARIWEAWESNDLTEGQHLVHTDALALGRSFVAVWTDGQGRAVASPESAREVAVQRDPVTREVTAALKRWTADGKGHAVLFTPEHVTRYVSQSHVPEGGMIPATGWDATQSNPNPLGVVPVVPFVNRGRMLDVNGVSEMTPVLDLVDALNKLAADLMVSSEFFARPKRWVTGLEIEEDEEGNPVNPFPRDSLRMLQSESPETKFGQFAASGLDGYSSAVSIITSQIGSLLGLPPHYLGVHGDQPASADAIRSSESSLVAKCVARQRTFDRSWSQVASLMAQVETGGRPARVEPVWASPETRTPAQAADAAAKLVQSGILPTEQALDDLGYSPEQITAMRGMRTREAFTSAIKGGTNGNV